jgi:hypothetical protein
VSRGSLGDDDLPVEVQFAADLLQLMRDEAEQTSLYG